MSKQILIVEDELNLAHTIQEYLSTKGFECFLVHKMQDALTYIATNKNISMAVLDINLPDGSGLDLAREIKKRSPDILFLFMSAMNDPETKLEGLEIGAEDYITKPFALKELSLRIDKILTVNNLINASPDEINIGTLKIRFKSFELIDAQNKKITLNQKECAILEMLWRNKNMVVSREDIIDEIWGKDSFPSNRTVDNYIVGLRKWAETDSSHKIAIVSIRGIGYKLEIN
jgi:two-component system, OmpR family, alkaline phosphatase synthesis response regulator PhoP